MEAEEEVAPPPVRKGPREPSEAERREHEELEHSQYRSWCKHCVGARGTAQPHLAAPEPDPDAPPKVCFDYCYMCGSGGKQSTQQQEKVKPILSVKVSKCKTAGASVVKQKGTDPYSVSFLTGFVKELGYKRVIFQSDGEPAIVALSEAATLALPGVEVVPQHSAPDDHMANGEAESGVRELKRKIRAMRTAFEERSHRKLSSSHPLLAWLPRHAANVLTRYRKGPDYAQPFNAVRDADGAAQLLSMGSEFFTSALGSRPPTTTRLGCSKVATWGIIRGPMQR